MTQLAIIYRNPQRRLMCAPRDRLSSLPIDSISLGSSMMPSPARAPSPTLFAILNRLPQLEQKHPEALGGILLYIEQELSGESTTVDGNPRTPLR